MKSRKLIVSADKSHIVLDDLPSEGYHSMTDYVSNSMLKVFMQSRRRYCAMYIDTVFTAKTTEAMKWGTILHTLILEPDKVNELAVQIPDGVLSDQGYRRGKPWMRWKENQQEGVTLLSTEEWRYLEAAAACVRRHPVAGALLSDPDAVEESIFWIDEQSGLPRKARIDLRKGRFIGDVKTTTTIDDDGFSRAMLAFGYHFQGEAYKTAVIEAGLIDDPEFILIPITKEPPFICWPRRVGLQSQAIAREQIQSALLALASCYQSDDWREPGEEDCSPLDVPIYELKKHGDI